MKKVSRYFLLFFLIGFGLKANAQTPLPFSVDSTHITMWNGESYVPIFIKGVNLGVAKPGTFPGQMAASREDYARWFPMIRAAGFNVIRLYTLHFPHFYEELKKFNEANPQSPLFVFQGVWLEEELENYDENLFFLTQSFTKEIEDNVSVVHGNKILAERQGKAYGTYTADISPWVMGYIIGREIHPTEVAHTNQVNPTKTNFYGNFLSIENTSATEVFLIQQLNHLVEFEQQSFRTQRPVSFSSWPTQDPLSHPTEINRYEDSTSIDLSKADFSKAKAGYFASYHAYPYYPDFVSRDPNYQNYFDYEGQNSYLGYLTTLKHHYKQTPLIVAEFGAPSSWGVAHYANNGIHHGGYDEKTQGEHAIRMFKTLKIAGSGGGILFSWLDEWFKRTWITDYVDYDIESRVLWHNVTAAEQNFGLLGYEKPARALTDWQTFEETSPIIKVQADANYTFFKVDIELKNDWRISDSLWIGIDSYDAHLGESVLPNKVQTTHRHEFALLITSFSAKLFVTQAYDLFGKFHRVSSPAQQYQSTASDGAPWVPVRWKNNSPEQEVQFVGEFKVNRLGLPPSSLDAVQLSDRKISVRIPWQLLQFTGPHNLTVLHDDRSTPETETRISDGFALSLAYRNTLKETSTRFVYSTWNTPNEAVEYKKASYYIIENELPPLFDTPIAVADTISVLTGELNEIDAQNGVLTNDLSLSGLPMNAILVKNPSRGLLQLDSSGAFLYQSEIGLRENDSFRYRVNNSEPVTVVLKMDGTPKSEGFLTLFPNPTQDVLTVKAKAVMQKIELYSILGQKIKTIPSFKTLEQIPVQTLANGAYYAIIYSGDDRILKRFTILK